MGHNRRRRVTSTCNGPNRVRGSFYLPTGSPEAATRLRLPQNVACGFPALRSSEIDSQHCDGLKLLIGKQKPWSHNRVTCFDRVEHSPWEIALAATAAQHLTPVALHRSGHSLQGTKVPAYPRICIMATQELRLILLCHIRFQLTHWWKQL